MTEPRPLASVVYLSTLSTEAGQPRCTTVALPAGTTPTPEQAAKITNPAAWNPQPTPPAVA